MSAQLHRSTNCGGPNSITSWLLFAAIGVVVSGIALHSVLYGPAMRETAERLRTEQTARENRALCEKLGMVHGSEQFAACTDVLWEARQLEAKQLASDIAGIL
jgi:hypothetical protein